MFTRSLGTLIILLRSCDTSLYSEYKQPFWQEQFSWLQPSVLVSLPSQLSRQILKLSCEHPSCEYNNDERVKNLILKAMCYFIINNASQSAQKWPLCGVVEKYLTILAQHHHFSIHFISYIFCVLLLLPSAPEKANSFQTPQSQVKVFIA